LALLRLPISIGTIGNFGFNAVHSIAVDRSINKSPNKSGLLFIDGAMIISQLLHKSQR
jgi:hypothetical protein